MEVTSRGGLSKVRSIYSLCYLLGRNLWIKMIPFCSFSGLKATRPLPLLSIIEHSFDQYEQMLGSISKLGSEDCIPNLYYITQMFIASSTLIPTM